MYYSISLLAQGYVLVQWVCVAVIALLDATLIVGTR